MLKMILLLSTTTLLISSSFVFAKENKTEKKISPLSKENITAEMKKQTELSRGSKAVKDTFKVSTIEKDDYANTIVKSTVKLENGETCKVQGREVQAPPVPGEKDQKQTLQMVNVKTDCSSPQKK